MDINRLNEFITLASCLNYSKAANQLFLTQPALSRHIAALEQSLETKLFYRDTHSVQLTAVGELFYAEAVKIMEHYNKAIALVQDATSAVGGELRIGFLGSAEQTVLTGFITGFTASHPQINLNMICEPVDALYHRLADNLIDLAFMTHVDKELFPDLESIIISKNRMALVMHPTHRLAEKETVSIRELSEETLIQFSPEKNPVNYALHKKMLKKAGIENNESTEVEGIGEMLFQVCLNKGVGIFPMYLTYRAQNLVCVPLEEEYCTINLNLVWKKNNPNPSIKLFVKEFQSYMKNH